MPETPAPVYSSNWELVSDEISYEYGNRVFGSASINIIYVKIPRKRMIRTKTYEATILDAKTNEVPAPAYLAGDLYVFANPENLSPVGNDTNQWHCDNISYSKELSLPCSRRIRISWVKVYPWQTIDESDSQ